MSWENVTGIKNIKIWTDYSDSTQGHLFVNNNHQLQLSVGISFTLKSGTTEGPTKDEVNAALSLINNQDSGPLKYLQLSPKGNFIQVYDPNHVQSTADSNTPEVEDGVYDFVLTYWVYSPTSINAEAYTETVALRVAYTDSAGNTIVKETSKKGNYSTKTFVTIMCYPAKLYGMSGGNRTNINIAYKDVAAEDRTQMGANYTHEDDYFAVYWLYIDDSYFKILSFNNSTTPNYDTYLKPIFITRKYESTMWDEMFNTFSPRVKCGEFTFTVPIEVMSDLNGEYIVLENIVIHQEEGQISLITSYIDVKHLHDSVDINNNEYFHLYDQFGNDAYVVLMSDQHGIHIQSVS